MNPTIKSSFKPLLDYLKNYDWRRYYVNLPSGDMKVEKIMLSGINLFANIDHVYYYYAGDFLGFSDDPGNQEYLLFFRLSVKRKGKKRETLYGWLEAWEDYTGFDCNGGIKIYLSKQKTKIEKYAISKKHSKFMSKGIYP